MIYSHSRLLQVVLLLVPINQFLHNSQLLNSGTYRELQNTISHSLLSDICEVPEARNSYYESANSILKTGDKVVSGTKIYFQCIDEGM